jgi:hypothetical protein
MAKVLARQNTIIPTQKDSILSKRWNEANLAAKAVERLGGDESFVRQPFHAMMALAAGLDVQGNLAASP